MSAYDPNISKQSQQSTCDTGDNDPVLSYVAAIGAEIESVVPEVSQIQFDIVQLAGDIALGALGAAADDLTKSSIAATKINAVAGVAEGSIQVKLSKELDPLLYITLGFVGAAAILTLFPEIAVLTGIAAANLELANQCLLLTGILTDVLKIGTDIEVKGHEAEAQAANETSQSNAHSSSANKSAGTYCPAHHDPIVIDLTGNGLNISELNTSSTYFDFNGNGFSVNTAWIAAGTAFLVIKSNDPNYGVAIGDGYELIGTGTDTGYEQLRSLISNDVGTISASDSIYSQLAVWQDTNNDGIAQSSEITSLATAGVKSISLNTSVSNETIDLSNVTNISSVTMADGQINQAGEINLASYNQYSEYTGPYTLSAQIMALPNIKGYGLISDLQIEMSFDPTLETMVQNLNTEPPDTVAGYDQAVQTIMYEWAGVINVAPSAGNIFDGQKLDFLADYDDEPASDTFSTNPSSGVAPWFIGQAIELSASWANAFDEIEARLLAQTPNSIWAQDFSVVEGTDLLLPNTDYTTAINDIAAHAPTDPSAAVTYWVQSLVILSQSIGDYVQNAPIDTPALIASIGNDIPFYISPDVETAALSGTLTYFDMSALNNLVYGTAGSDLYDVSTPNMTIEGFGGGDEIIVNKGAANLNINEVENNPANTNVLFFAPGINESDLTVKAETNGDIILTYDAQGDQVTLDSMDFGLTSGSEQGPLHTTLPYTPATEFGVQEVVFADGTTLSAQQVIDMVSLDGSPTNTTIVSSGGVNMVDPKGYASLVFGRDSTDTIFYQTDYGNITINENSSQGPEQSVLQFGAGISAAELLVGSDAAGDLILTLGTTGTQITLVGMNASDSDGVANVIFADGTSLSAAQLLAMSGIGSPQNESIYANADATLYDPSGYAHSVSGITAGDTVVYNQGYGDLTIAQSTGGVLAFGSLVSASDIYVASDANGNVILTDVSTGSTINIAGMATGGLGVNEITFCDGTTWSSSQILELADIGSPYNTILRSDSSANYFDLNGYAETVDGSDGNDTIYYALNDGNVTINEDNQLNNASTNATLQFGPGILPSDIYISSDGESIIIGIISTGATIDISGMFSLPEFNGVSQISFADGTVWSSQQILNFADTGSAENKTLQGFNEDQVLDPNGFAHTIVGVSDSDTILYNLGYGNLNVYGGFGEESSSFYSPSLTTLSFGPGILENNVETSSGPNDDILITIANSGVIDLAGHVSGVFGTNQISTITFADGSSYTPAQLLEATEIGTVDRITTLSGPQASDINATGSVSTVIDQIGNADTIAFDAGDQNLFVNEYNPNGTEQSIIQFGTGISVGDIEFSHAINQTVLEIGIIIPIFENSDLVATDIKTGAQITLTDMVNGLNNGVADFVFADGTTISAGQAIALADTGSSNNTTLIAGAEAQTFDPKGFAHKITDNDIEFSYGSSAPNTILYDLDYGNLSIDLSTGNVSPEQSEIIFGPGITAAGLAASTDQSGDIILTIKTTGSQITLVGMENSFEPETQYRSQSYFSAGVGSLVFADGSTLSAEQFADVPQIGYAGEFDISSPVGSFNTFDTKGFVHIVDGGQSSNVIFYNVGYGDLAINESAATSQSSVLQFGPGIAASLLEVTGDSNGDVIITLATLGTTIQLNGMLLSPDAGVGSLAFSDGTTISADQLVEMAETGSSINTVLYANTENQPINPGGAAHVFNGNGFNDVINYSLSDGNLIINESSQGYAYSPYSPSNTNTGPVEDIINFGAGISASDITASAEGNDIILTVEQTGSHITLSNMLLNGSVNSEYFYDPVTFYAGVAALTFEDGTTLSSAQIFQLLDTGTAENTVLTVGSGVHTLDPGGFAHVVNGNSGTDTIIYNPGYGNLVINETNPSGPEQSVLQIGSGIAAADIAISGDAAGDIILTDDATGNEITLTGMLASGNDGVGSIVFLDPSTLTAQQILTAAETGSPTNTVLYAGSANTTFQTGGYAQVINGNGGADTILYTASNTDLQINEQTNGSAEQSILQFGSGISAANVTIATDGYGDVLLSLGSLGGEIDITGMLNGTNYGVGALQFADGTSLSAQQIDDDAGGVALANSTLYATLANSTLDTKGFESTIQGNGGADTIIYNLGYGNLTIIEQNPVGPEESVLQLGAGISPSDIAVSQDANGDILLTISSSSVIKLFGMASSDQNGVAAVTFVDGTTWSASQIISMTDVGSATNTTLNAGPGNNVFDPQGLAGVVNGDGGSDIIIFNQGYGQLTINEENQSGAEQSILQFGSGITAGELSVSQDAFGDIILKIGTSGDQVTISSMLHSGDNGISYGIGEAIFTDGTTLTAQQLFTLADTGTANNTVLHTGPDSGTIDPAGFANLVEGYDGQNTILYNPGYGDLTINEQIYGSSAQSILQFGSGISDSELNYFTASSGNIILSVGSSGEQITLSNMINTGTNDIGYGVGSLSFFDGTTLSAAQVIAYAEALPPPVASTISVASALVSSTDEVSINFLSGTSIIDPNAGTVFETLTITPSSTLSGTLYDPNSLTDGSTIINGTLTISAAATVLNGLIHELSFMPVPHQVAPGDTITTQFTIFDLNSSSISSSAEVSVVATAVNDAPTITGSNFLQSMTDEGTLEALSSIVINDPDVGVTDAALITLTGTAGLATDGNGTLSGLGLTKIGTGQYSLVASTPGSLTAELDALVFTPQAHQVAPGGTVMTAIELAVSQNGATSTYAAASIVVTAENDKPEIAGTKTSQTITNEATLHALSSVVISDLDVGVTDSVLITLTGTGGIITDTDGILSGAGLTKIGAGLYTLAAATPGSLTTELEALVFTPTVHQIAPSSTVITGIDLAVTQNGQTATDSTTSIIDFQNMSSGSTISCGLETVGSGGTAVSTTVLSSGIEEILSGGVSSNSTVLSGGTEYDYGASFNDTINGGTQTVYGGGTAVGTFLESGGAQYISNGVTAENTLISGGGQQYVLSGGVASDTSINYEGAQVVETGGIASGNTITVAGSSLISGGISYATVVVNGGSEDVFAGSSVDAVINDANQFIYGGTVSGAELENHGVQYLSGGSAYATDVEGGTQVVTSGGVANGSTIVAGGRQFVYSGGLVSGNIVNAVGTDYISGGTAYATELNNGGSEQVFDGGTASGSTVDSGSIQNVYSGGLSENTTISGGLEIVSSGGMANSTSILSSGVENILVGGAASGATVGFDGEQFVSSGGTVSGTGVNSGGTEYVLTGGVEKNTVLDNGSTDFDYGQSINVTVNSGGGLAVSGGGVLTGGTLEAGGIEVIASGGQSFDETVASGGRALISGGSAYAYTLNNGREVVYAGGTASGAVVNEGGEENVFDTGTTSGAIINSGGQENISAGAIAYDVTVNSGGVEVVNGTSVLFGQLVQSDGIASGTTIKSGGYLVVLPGGIVNGATINSGANVISSGIVDLTPTGVTVYDNSVNGGNIGGLGATQYVLSGGTTSGVVVNSGGVQSVVSSGISVDSIIASGGIQVISSGGYSVGPIVNSGGIELVSGGNVFFANIDSGGYDAVYNGGTTADTTINSGATEILYSGGVSNEAIVHNGGQETVAGGVATDTTLQIGGYEVVDSGGVAFVTSGFTASGLSIRSGGQNIIQAGGLVSATTVTSGGSESNFGSSVSATIIGGEELIENGGTAVDLSISQGGFDIVDSGGLADGTKLLAGGTEYDYGTVTSAIVNNGAQELVLLTGSATENTVGLGGQQIVYSGGIATNTDLLSGGSEIVYSGGIASDTTIQNGGSQTIFFSGDVVETSVNSGGLQIVEFYGTTSDTTIEDGGTESVTDIGTADNTSILSGGIEKVSVYGNSYDAIVHSGGTENVLAGGTETGSTIYSGGIQIVSSGGAVVNTTIDGGTVILDAGSVVGGGINFIGNNGTLVISGSSLPTNVISGFDASGTTGDDIDLTGYSFSSSDTASLGANNVLTLNLSGAIETLSFNPTQNFSNDYFAIEENSLGQVVVVDPTISSSTSSFTNLNMSKHSDHIDTGLMKLIAAMAEFSAGTPLSNFELVNQIPANTNLEAAIAANWHS